MNRRDFVQLMGLAGGASLLNSCIPERQTEKIIPYLVPPDDGVIPGVAVFKKTTCTECPAGCGIDAKVVDYRAGKLEGVGGHPIGNGSLCLRGQASLSSLYHPDRIKAPLRRNVAGGYDEISWDEAWQFVVGEIKRNKSNVFLSGRTTGSLSGVIDEFAATTGVERLPEFELFSYAAIRQANRTLFDRAEIPAYRIGDADFMLTLGADLFETFTSPVYNASEFSRAKQGGRFDWYHVEPHASLTGMQAKRRFTLTPGSEPYLLTFLLHNVAQVNLAGDRHIAGMIASLPELTDRGYAEKTGLTVSELHEISDHLLRARRPLVIAGGVSTMSAHGLETALMTGLLQWALGMIGNTVDFGAGENYDTVGTMKDVERLAGRLDRGEIGVVFLSRVDAIAGLSGKFDLKERLGKAKIRIGLGSFRNEIMGLCDLILPVSDPLESWGDAAPRRNTLSVIQPAIEPLHNTMSEGDILLQTVRQYKGADSALTYQQRLFQNWKSRFGDARTEELLVKGYLKTNGAARDVKLDRGNVNTAFRSLNMNEAVSKPFLVMTPSIRFFDGRSRYGALTNEVPDPMTTVTYGAWVSMSKESAHELGAREKSEVTIKLNGWSQDAAIKHQPGLPKGVMTVQYGAVNTAPIAMDERCGELVSVFEGASVSGTGRMTTIPVLSGSLSQEGRGVIPEPDHGSEHDGHDPNATLYKEKIHKNYRWAMAIDLDLCIGCSACSVACYVENNLAVVGPELHNQGREMSWIRIEPFYEEDGTGQYQPMLCQQCTNAPCESVCPVFATFHNEDGLNAQVYNRCVGTRYCLNNCPYKVRRFNWFDWDRPSTANSTRNPEVSIRGRGVMEKCTFCVQRIRKARDHAKDNDRLIQDGEVVTACQQACPTSAITFGNIKDENSEVAKKSKSDRVYRVFEQLGTQPAVYYLRNQWKAKAEHAESSHATDKAHG